MKVYEAIERIDAMVRNTYTREEKLFWLSNLDAQIATFILRTQVPEPYTPEKSMETVLLAKAPFDMMYLHWLEAQIAYANGELERYNNALTTFQQEYTDFTMKQARETAPTKVTTMKYF